MKEAASEQEKEERLRLYYVAMTRAIDRLIVSGAIDPARSGRSRDADRLGARPPRGARHGRRGRRDSRSSSSATRRGSFSPSNRFAPEVDGDSRAEPRSTPTSCSSRSSTSSRRAALVSGSSCQPLVEIPCRPLHDVRRLSYSALALFERCSYRYYAERVLGLPPRAHTARTASVARARRDRDRRRRASAARARAARRARRARARGARARPCASGTRRCPQEELERIAEIVDAYCRSDLARRVAGLHGARPERPFTFEHDGVVIRGRLDVLLARRLTSASSSTTSRTRSRAGRRPRSSRPSTRSSDSSTRSCAFAPEREDVEVAYQFLERPDDVVSTTFTVADVPALEAELSAAIATHPRGRVSPDPERVRVLGLPGARPRLRRAAARAARGNVASCASRRSATSTATCRRSRRCSPRSTGRESTRSSSPATRLHGPWPAEVVDLLVERERALSCAGNADREVLERSERYGQLAPWSADRLGERRLAVVRELAADGRARGRRARRRCSSATRRPTSDDPIYTRITPGRRSSSSIFESVAANVVVCGHTHMQYDRTLVDGLRVVNPGSVGMPYEGAPRRVLGAARPGRRVPTHGLRRRGRVAAIEVHRCSGGRAHARAAPRSAGSGRDDASTSSRIRGA